MAETSFKAAFAAARKEKGAGATFTWRGKSYSTDRADDKKSTVTASTKSAPAKGKTEITGTPTRRGGADTRAKTAVTAKPSVTRRGGADTRSKTPSDTPPKVNSTPPAGFDGPAKPKAAAAKPAAKPEAKSRPASTNPLINAARAIRGALTGKAKPKDPKAPKNRADVAKAGQKKK